MKANSNPSHILTFSKSQITAFLATIVDFSVLTLGVEQLGFNIAWATASGAFCGAITNFFANRNWTFEGAKNGNLQHQGFKYLMVSAGSLALNTLFVWLLTEKLGVYYLYSKAATALLVGFFYNYPLHRYFVYAVKTQ